MLTKLMRTNLDGAVSTEAANKCTKSILQTVDTIQWVFTGWFICWFLFPKAMNIPGAKSGSGQGMRQIEKMPARQESKVRNKQEVIEEAQKASSTVHFATLMDLSSQFFRIWQWHKYKGRLVLRGDCSEGWFVHVCAFRWTRFICIAYDSSHSIICEDAPKLLRLLEAECPVIWICLPHSRSQKSSDNIPDPVVPLERHLYGRPSERFLLARTLAEVLLEEGRAIVPGWECLCTHRKVTFLSVYADETWRANGLAETHLEKADAQGWSGRTYSDRWPSKPGMPGMQTARKRKKQNKNNCVRKSKSCSSICFHPVQAWLPSSTLTPRTKWYQGVTACWVMHKSVLNVIANLRTTKQQTNCTKCLRLAWMTTNSKRKNWKLCECYVKFAHVPSSHCDFFFARSVTKWTRACDKRLARLTSYHHQTRNCRQHCHVFTKLANAN